jgi:phosphate transport system permease protein
VLPSAIPGIATGSILALARAIGETAPLILVGALTYVSFNPTIMGPFTALPIQIYQYISRPQEEFKLIAAAAIIVLLAILLTMNAFAIWLRNRYQKRW